MNIVFLSGGSGKRLWPLSNNIRSKQFIKLIKNDNGDYESMVQRVYRQITEIKPDINITIATSKSQVSSIRNQLGDKVSICVEPSRRDTFPAISLAAAFLYYESGVSADECIAVCPVDPYVNSNYYECILKMENVVKSGGSALTLMGIEPTYPSDKYGYIIPTDNSPVSTVREFKEKPDIDVAKTYLDQNALWNAGVFAFKLEYILNKSHEIIDYKDYRDLFVKYDMLEKTSFDYAVVEKEPSIQVIRYVGEWKDIGTWNMMTEVMADNSKGNVTMDDTCRNTNIVNELDIPILCMGCKDMVIAASGDGILVSDKERSGYIKPFVDKISIESHYAEKSWGSFVIIDVQPYSMTIKISLQAGKSMTYHVHEFRDEVWTILSGEGKTLIDGMEQDVHTGDVICISAGCKHTIIASSDMSIIETQIGSEISKLDKTVFNLPKDFANSGFSEDLTAGV